jgi:hypothetical protein
MGAKWRPGPSELSATPRAASTRHLQWPVSRLPASAAPRSLFVAEIPHE